MAPPLSPVGIIYQALIQSNCQTFLGNDVDVDIVSQLDSTGTWRVHVLKTERGKRTAVLSEASQSLQGAFIELHRKSAKAVDNFVATNGFDLPPELSTRTSRRHHHHHHHRGCEKERSSSSEHLEIVSVGSESASPISSESEDEDEGEVSAESESDDSLDRNALGGRRCRKTHRRGSRRMTKKHDGPSGSGGPAHRPVVIHNLPAASAPGATSTTIKTTAPIPAPTSVCVPPPPAPITATRHFGGFNPTAGPWRGSWRGPTVLPPPPPPPPPGVFRLGTLMQGPQPHSNFTPSAPVISNNHHRQQVRPQPPPPPPQPMGLQQQKLAQQIRHQQQSQNQSPPHKLPTHSSVMLRIRWLPHGEATILDECYLSVRAVQNRTLHLLRTRGLELLEGVSPLEVTPSALEALCVTVRRLRVGEQVYALGPGFQDDLSALQAEPPQFLVFEVEVTAKIGGQGQHQQQQRQQWLFTGVGQGKTGMNGDE